MSKLSKEDLEKRLKDQIKAIPSPTLSPEQIKAQQEKNRQQDRENLDHTMKILHERQSEADLTGDKKKRYAAIAVEHDQRDQYNIRNRHFELQEKWNFIQRSIPTEDWEILEPLCETAAEDEHFWERGACEGGYSEQELHKCLRDDFDVNPKYIVKVIELIKIKKELIKLENIDPIQNSTKKT